MRYGISALAVGAALCLMGASGWMNFHFWLRQGETEREADILGSVSVAFDIFKSVLPLCIAWAWREGRRGYVFISVVTFALFFASSFLSALGFAAGNRGVVSGRRESLGLRFETAAMELEATKLRLKDIARHQPQTVIEAELRELQQDKFWKGSQNCDSPSGGQARDFCKNFFAKRTELASAIEAERLTKRIAELTAAIDSLKHQGAGEDKDPQAHMLALLAGLPPDMAQKVLIVGFAIIVELGAAFGLFLATGHSFERKTPVLAASAGGSAIAAAGESRLMEAHPAQKPLRLKRLGDGKLTVDDGWGGDRTESA